MRISISILRINYIEKFYRQKIMFNSWDNPNYIAESEIYQIFIGLQLFAFEGLDEIILEKFQQVYVKFRTGRKYRNPKLLIPIIIYIYFGLFDHKLDKSDLLAVSEISSSDFNDFIMQLRNYLSRMI